MPSAPARSDAVGAAVENPVTNENIKHSSRERQGKGRQRSRERKRESSRERESSQEKKRESSGERQSSQEKKGQSSGDRQSSPEKNRQSSGERQRSQEKKRQNSRDRQSSRERKGKGKGEKGKSQFVKGKGKGKPVNAPVCNGNATMISRTRRISDKDPLLDGRRLRGFVKHYCPLQGFGMIRCDEHKIDVIVNRLEAEQCDATSGATISFSLERDEDGKPLARDVRVLLKGTTMKHRVTKLQGVEIDWSTTYVGTVKVTWNGGKESIFVVPSMQKRDTGGAFIGSDESFKVFGDDIWAYPCRIPGGLKVGDMLKFKVEIDHFWSYPVAVHIQRAEPIDSTRELEVADAATSLEAQKTVTPRRKSRSPGRERSNSRNRNANKQPKPQPADAHNEQKPDTGAVHDIEASLPTPSGTSAQKGELEDGDQLAQCEENSIAVEVEKDANDTAVDESLQELNTQDSSHRSNANASVWKRYQMEDGESYWWWCELDNDCFLEANPGPWTRFLDPDTERHYWWKSEDKWFWI